MPDTVHGVPLEDGEHVLAVDVRPGSNGSPVPAFIVGVLLSVILIGLVILYRLFTEKDKMRAWTIVTNKRVFELSKSGRVLVEIPVAAIDSIGPAGRAARRSRFARITSLRSSSLGKSVQISRALIFHDRTGTALALERVLPMLAHSSEFEGLAPVAHKP